MISVCCVYDCPANESPQNDGTGGECSAAANVHSFYHFPIEDPARAAEWCDLLSIDTDSNLGEMLVCRRHFSPQQYDFSSDCKNPLKVDAVPDSYLPKIVRRGTPKEEIKSKVAQRSTEDKFNPPVLVVNDLGKVCRLCLETDEQATHESMFDKPDIVDFIAQSIGIEVHPNDGYPQMICQTCIERVTYIHRSREWFHKNDQFLKALVGELSNEVELPLTESVEEPISIDETLPNEPQMIETDEQSETEMIECKEAVLEEIITQSKSNYPSSVSKTLTRKKLKKRNASTPLLSEKPFDALDVRSEMLEQCIQTKSANGKYICGCGAVYKGWKRLLKHLTDEHDTDGNVTKERKKQRPPPQKVRADPCVLEQMAAVFNGLKQKP